jgi:hypothetical protein
MRPRLRFGYTLCGVRFPRQVAHVRESKNRHAKTEGHCRSIGIWPSAKPYSPFGDTVNGAVSAEERYFLAMIDTTLDPYRECWSLLMP